MRLSAAAELAVRGAIILASEYGNGPVTLKEICRRRDLPKQYLVKIFATLSRNGLIRPIRGKNGGYVLAHHPSETTVLQVIEAVEGPTALNYCQDDPPQCDHVDCAIRPIWAELQKIFREKLGAVTLADCVTGSVD